MYTLLVCADMFGEKINLEVTFPSMPTISELNRKIVETFNQEAALKRPPGYPNIEFTTARLQIYDDVLLKWTDLVTCTQLHEYDQLYAFQPQSPWHIDVQKDLPPPRPPTSQHGRAPPTAPPTPADAYGGSSSRGYAAASYAAPTPSGAYGGSPAPHVQQRSPTQDRLEQQRLREEQLRAELARVHEETARLEAAAAAEEEERRRQQTDDKDRLLRQREAEIQRQRELLRQMEDDYQRSAQQSGGRR